MHRAQPAQPRPRRASTSSSSTSGATSGSAAGAGCEAIEALKDEGKIRFFGVSINDHQPANAIRLIESGAVDTVQVIYNVFDQSPEDELLGRLRAHGVGVIVRVPLDEGALTGRIGPDTEFPEGDFRNDYFRGDRKRAGRPARARRSSTTSASSATSWQRRRCASSSADPAVSTVIPGMRTVRNVERNCAVGDGARPARRSRCEALHAHRWDRNFYAA